MKIYRSRNQPTIPAQNFVEQIAANVDNNQLSDAEFRAFIRMTLSIVERPKVSAKR